MWKYNFSCDNDYLMHYGVPGMKWGVRNYQNPDGSLTLSGRLRYGRAGLKKEKYEKKLSKYTAKKERYLEKAGKPINRYTDLGANHRHKLAKFSVKEDKVQKKIDRIDKILNEASNVSVSELESSKTYYKKYKNGQTASYLALGIVGNIAYTVYKNNEYKIEQAEKKYQ